MSSPINGWSDAKWRSWVISLLRRGSLRFPNRTSVLKEAKTEKKINESSGRLAQHYKCAGCNKDFPASKICVDHIEPVVEVSKGFQGWDVYISRMFCTRDKLQVLCKQCHNSKTSLEKNERML